MASDYFSLVESWLAAAGFRHRSKQILTIDLTQDALGWLGLNVATEHLGKGRVLFNPVVGVRHAAIEKLVAEFRAVKYHSFKPPTISQPLRYLLPDTLRAEWLMTSEPVADEFVARQITDFVVEYAMPFMRGSVDIAEICRLIDVGVGHSHQLMYRGPVAYLLRGDVAEADQRLKSHLAEMGGRTDEAASDYTRFATRFREYVQAIPG